MAVVATLGAVLTLWLHAASYPDCLSDDAFISFRYAANWAEGHGLVFNPGESRPVEGYTNFLWTVILGLGISGGLEPESLARALGLLLAGLTLLCAAQLTRTLAPDSPWVWPLPAWVLALDSYFVAEAVQGLETVLFALLLLAGLLVWCGERGQPARSGRGAAAGLLFGLAALTRPEGAALFAVVALTTIVGERRRSGSWPLRGAFVAAAIVAAMVAVHLAFRVATYGDWLPNTFHAKTGGGPAQAARGLAYLLSGWRHLLPVVLTAAAALLPRPVPGSILVAGVWLASTAGVVAVGGDFKPTYRFLMWTLPLLATLSALGVARISWGLSSGLVRAGAAPDTPAPRARVAAGAAGVAGLVLVAGWVGIASQPGRDFMRQRQVDLGYLRQAASWLAGHFPQDTVLATGPSGAIPFYTRWETIDMWGLNHRDIARRRMPSMGSGTPGHEKGDGRAVLAGQPDIVLFTAARLTPKPFPAAALPGIPLSISERELLSLPAFRDGYSWHSAPLADGALYLNYFQRTPAGAGGTAEIVP